MLKSLSVNERRQLNSVLASEPSSVKQQNNRRVLRYKGIRDRLVKIDHCWNRFSIHEVDGMVKDTCRPRRPASRGIDEEKAVKGKVLVDILLDSLPGLFKTTPRVAHLINTGGAHDPDEQWRSSFTVFKWMKSGGRVSLREFVEAMQRCSGKMVIIHVRDGMGTYVEGALHKHALQQEVNGVDCFHAKAGGGTSTGVKNIVWATEVFIDNLVTEGFSINGSNGVVEGGTVHKLWEALLAPDNLWSSPHAQECQKRAAVPFFSESTSALFTPGTADTLTLNGVVSEIVLCHADGSERRWKPACTGVFGGRACAVAATPAITRAGSSSGQTPAPRSGVATASSRAIGSGAGSVLFSRKWKMAVIRRMRRTTEAILSQTQRYSGALQSVQFFVSYYCDIEMLCAG